MALVLIRPMPSQTAKPAPIAPSQIREETIGECARGTDMTSLRIATVRGERHVAWIEQSRDGRTVRLDGKQVGGVYDEVKFLGFRGGDRQLSFIASRKPKWMLVVNGQERGDYTKVTAPDVDAEGALAAGVCHDKTCRLLMGDREIGPAFDDIGAPDFSPSAEHYVYFGKREKKWIAIVDGKEVSTAMDDFWRVQWGPDGKRLAVAAQIDDQFTWIVDGQPGPRFDVISAVAFSGDGQHYAYGGISATTAFKEREVRGGIVVDGTPPAQTYVGRGMPGTWRALLGQVQWIVKGVKALSTDFHGVSDPEYTAKGELVFGQRLADNRVVVSIGNRPGPAFDDIVSPIMVAPDGEHVVYVGKQGDSFVEVRDQTPGASFPAKRDVAFVPWIAMTKNGRLMYEIVRGGAEFKAGRSKRAERRVVVDGAAGPEYDALGMACQLSDADQQYACAVLGADGNRARIVVNGQEGKPYDEIVAGSIRFLPTGGVEFIARQDQRILRVTIAVTGRPAVTAPPAD